jgi:glutamine amidotransferase
MVNLRNQGLDEILVEWINSGKPFMGVCLGLQLLLEESDEGDEKGLGVLEGRVEKLPEGQKIPHMGWNQVTLTDNHPLFNGINSDEFFYFVHSYYVEPSASKIIKGTTRYGLNFSSVISIGNMIGVQFHPEKSGFVGLKFYENFIELVKSKKNLSCY